MAYNIPPFMTPHVHTLSPDSIIGRGNKRHCHAHPTDTSLCIKVARFPDRWQECHKQSLVEWHYISYLKRRHIRLEHIMDCYGWVQTNYGPGLVLERIRNEDGSAAITLRESVEAGKLNEAQLMTLLEEVRDWASRNAIAVADLNGTNLMVRRRNNTTSLVLVDGIARRQADWQFTLYQRFLWMARFKTSRQWKRQAPPLILDLQKRMHKAYLENRARHQLDNVDRSERQ